MKTKDIIKLGVPLGKPMDEAFKFIAAFCSAAGEKESLASEIAAIAAAPGNFARWRAHVLEAARRPNLLMKLGGLAGARCGFGFNRAAVPSLDDIVRAWRPYVETCIEAFGPARCMFESNFPVDSLAGTYARVWNAFKAIAASCSAAEKASLFHNTARRAYRIAEA